MLVRVLLKYSFASEILSNTLFDVAQTPDTQVKTFKSQCILRSDDCWVLEVASSEISFSKVGQGQYL